MTVCLSKLCSDFLRETYSSISGDKLKASHAHEIVAACMGYKSRAALLAESQWPLSDMNEAEVLIPHVELIKQRLDELKGLPAGLVDTLPPLKIAKELSNFLKNERHFSGQLWLSESLAEYIEAVYLYDNSLLIEDELSGVIAGTNASFSDMPDCEEIVLKELDEGVSVIVNGVLTGDPIDNKVYCGHEIGFRMDMFLPRVSGCVGFLAPEIEVGGAIK
eukprot:gnl/TRDRNA2_/TRDRNA2_165523_c0_seq2.p1 gnl/TRDRNA2_/TRDRNA2_165523_c0~~gnl/TRDRNA2_/TRDRNA2_165523_c0_seq2.p1  ORF type:complete len:219 (+),score=9.83 gnl/TRDRNA2_/TRDRNA2_165523_c0_seq2:168-824(+)